MARTLPRQTAAPPPTSQGTWRLEIPDWTPTPLNQILGHWAARNRLKKADYLVVGWYFARSGIPAVALPRDVRRAARALGIDPARLGIPAAYRRRVTTWIGLGPSQRTPDDDAHLKVLLDSLANCGAIVDDNPRWCVPVLPIGRGRGPRRRTVITLEDLP